VKRQPKRVAIFQPEFLQDLRFRVRSERTVAVRVLDLVEAVMQDPFEGPGKPEPLKYVLAGCWSRRVTQGHRLVYCVTDLGCRFPTGSIPLLSWCAVNAGAADFSRQVGLGPGTQAGNTLRAICCAMRVYCS
jgi:toxin YoeB